MSMEMRMVLFVAIVLVAVVRPKWVFPLLIPVGCVALVVLVAIWLLGATLGVTPYAK